MALPLGYRHTPEARASMARTRLGRKHSEAHRAAISNALRGKARTRRHRLACATCDRLFWAANPSAKFCSRNCKRGAQGHSLVHSRAFAAFVRACAICGRRTELVGDHDHATNTPRGVICRTCNLALGNMRDDPARLRQAARYLEGGKVQRVYLAGKMSGLPQFGFPAFDAAAADLRQQGFEVVSPAEMDDPADRAFALQSEDGVGLPPGASWGSFLARDIRLIADGSIEAIYVLPGWEQSRGARLETFVARSMCGLYVFEYPSGMPVSAAALVEAWAGGLFSEAMEGIV